MSKIRIEHILIGLLSILIINSFINVFKGSGASEEEVEWRIKYHDLEKANTELLHQNDTLKIKYETIEKNVSADSLTVWTADDATRDSLREYYNPK